MISLLFVVMTLSEMMRLGHPTVVAELPPAKLNVVATLEIPKPNVVATIQLDNNE